MPLTEQQLFLLLIISPALISGIAVYVLMLFQQKRHDRRLQLQLQQSHDKQSQLQQELQHSEKNLAVRNQQILSLHHSGQDLKTEISQLKQQALQQTKQLHAAQTEVQTLQVEMQQQRQFAEQQIKQLEQNREQLTREFKILSEQVLKSAQQEFSTQSRQGLDVFLQPFRQQINDFKQKVESIHTQDLKQREALKTELKQLQQLNREMTDEAHQLSTALKGQMKTQGNWGELILENVLDRSGLQNGKDYRREVSFNTDDGRKRPDVIVYLPDDRQLIIDAKVSLNAYTRFVNAQSEAEKNQAIGEHVQAISDRISELSSKQYYDLPGLKSPEMVFMFIPLESAFIEAVRADDTLFQQAIDQKVLVTTPTTLLTSLNIVRQLWRFEDQNRHSARLADQASKVYNQLRLFLENMLALGEQLDKSKATYDTAMKQFISGRGNLVKRVEDFQKLGVAVKKEMPPELLDKAEMELDLIDAPVASVQAGEDQS
jgi:DNA recombination protein RmuC